MKKPRIALAATLIVSMLLPMTSFGQESRAELVSPMNIAIQKNVSSLMVERIFQEQSEKEIFLGLDGLIKNFGPWITLEDNGEVHRMYITSYLLQTGREEAAAWLVNNGLVESWMTYSFGNGVANDFVIAVSTGSLTFLEAIFEDAPEFLNTPIIVNLEGQKALPLAIIASDSFSERSDYENIIFLMLKHGANPHKKMDTGLSPMIVASSSNNTDFISITQTFLDGQLSSPKGMFENTPLSSEERLEMQAIADAWIEKSGKERQQYNYSKLYNLWVQMIMKGYNIPADLMFDELSSRSQFDINQKSKGGVSPLMAVALSSPYGGNVEYGKLLIERGADPKSLLEIDMEGDKINVNLIQLALRKDNYKVVALFIVNNVGFATLPDNENSLILAQAIEQKAYKSASVIKEALNDYLKRSGIADTE
ncbi:MAG: hypothetical protein CBC55_03540 [Gammaproteobacteria bacterium TMED95]|uniref:Ankyrin n=1 Tax=Alteromonas mediterranea TaxID=314275 RepID=A0AAC9JES8_9ALTE|nr:ankyrin repeat domain-containing protein [Alteromonas mediterranea]APD92483.1 hypothetical protein BM524_21510 [Alteromonas mediterranea]APE00344.1 hypothetical protein BM525_21730 [Alteromonas mediterranea]OUV22594.1 MAG: hypothetical protein CBC55_03540 [Gammaproteobacteria bacterium TMED95]|tara:strand:- start:1789 stop:3057 length:1269 start_codon:yes stop_codon:yes gene_type:complete